jgi:serine/threonine-protein kinase
MTLVNKTISHYRIVSMLGAGGMGEVYLAEDSALGRKVALKLLPSEFVSNDERLRRFVQEARAAAALNHPNIAHIYEVGEAGGIHLIAMEFVDGETLTSKLHTDRKNLSCLLKILSQVAEGLAKAHSAGIVHRDLKPDNIMVTRDGYAKILDFGLAKVIESQNSLGAGEEAPTAMMPIQPLSTAGTVMGTVGYMSPEQAQGKAVDQRSDIFSFGCILYEAATGRRAFEGDSAIDTLHKIIYGAPPPITDFNSAAPADLQRIVRRCLAKDPEKRYQTIRDVANDLEDLRRQIASDAEAEYSAPVRAASAAAHGARETASAPSGASSRTPAPSISGAEYLIGGIKRYRRSALIVFVLVSITAVGIGYFYYAGVGAKAIDSIAVLPFVNTGGDGDTEYLSDGIAETMINSLTQLQQLRVIARTTAFRYKGKDVDPQEVGRELKVRAVLMGRVRQIGNMLTIQADLVDATTGAQLWGEEYNRRITDLLAVKQEIAREIVEKLRLRLTGQEQQQLTRHDTTNPEAYQFYLRGRYHWNKRTADGLKKAIEQFQQATALDPGFALGYAGLADCYLLLEQYAGTPASENLPHAKAAAERALQIDDSLAEAHASLASYHYQSWEWEEAEKEFKRAISLNPNYPTARHWYQLYLRTRGRMGEALAEIKRAQELDPLSPILFVNTAFVYFMNGDIDSCMEQAQRLVELDPHFSLAYEPLGRAYIGQRKYTEAIAAFQQDVASDRTAYALSYLGYAYAVAGRHSEALALLKELQEKYRRRECLGQYIAMVYAGLGDKDQAFAWIEKDFQARSGFMDSVVTDPFFDSLHGDPRYDDLLRRIGLST